MAIRRFAGPAAAGLILILAAAAAAQLPNGTAYVASSVGEKASKAIVAFDGKGVLTSIIPLQNAVVPASLTMGPDNEQLLVWDHDLLHRYHVLTGAQNPRTIVAPGLSGGLLDEDGGMVWATNQGLLLKSNDQACTKLYTVTWFPDHVFGCVGWNGSTGEWVLAAQQKLASSWKLLYIDASGYVNRSITGLPRITGIDWSPWSGDLYATYATQGGGVLRIDGKAAVTTLGLPAGAAREELEGVEVREQPLEELICVEGGKAPQHLVVVSPSGGLTTLHTSSGAFGPSDVEIVQQRPIWALNQWAVGKMGTLHVNFGAAQAGKTYQVALSFGHAPGIPLPPVGTAHLSPDSLFLACFLVGPPVFNNFVGVLDTRGRAVPDPTALVPNLFELIGVRIYGGAIAFDSKNVTAVSNCWGTTLRYT